MPLPVVCQFVDAITDNPAVRLDLNDQVRLRVGPGASFTPPKMRRAEIATMLTEGEQIPAAAFDNRRVVLPLQLHAPGADTAGLTLRLLHRELNRPRNVLRVQFGSTPFFFRTYRAPDYTHEILHGLLEIGSHALELRAEPFAYGLREDLPPITVANNPAAAGGCHFDVDGVKGDVDAPAVLRVATQAGPTTGQLVLAGRRRTAQTLRFVVQAEAAEVVANTNTSVLGNDANMSGGSYARVAFASSGTYAERLILPWPPLAGAKEEHKGTFRVFARVRKTVASDTITVNLATAGLGPGSSTTLPAGGGPMVVDLDLVTVGGVAPDVVGLAPTRLIPSERVRLGATRVSGSGALDIDWVALAPADDQMTLIWWAAAASTFDKYLDGENNSVYAANGDLFGDPQARISNALFERAGGLPALSPHVTNRFLLLASRSRTADVLGDATTVTASYWPRYLLPA